MAFYRAAAILLLLFAAGHTFGFLTFRPSSTEGLQVFDAMNRVHFRVKGSTFSYGNFYEGFGLSITASQLFLAVLAWWLGGLASRAPRDVIFITWALVALQLIGFGLSLKYFALAPAVFSLSVVACLVVAVLRVRATPG